MMRAEARGCPAANIGVELDALADMKPKDQRQAVRWVKMV